jgi:hypothetical protein
MPELQKLIEFIDTSPINASVIIKYSYPVIRKAKDKDGLSCSYLKSYNLRNLGSDSFFIISSTCLSRTNFALIITVIALERNPYPQLEPSLKEGSFKELLSFMCFLPNGSVAGVGERLPEADIAAHLRRKG